MNLQLEFSFPSKKEAANYGSVSMTSAPADNTNFHLELSFGVYV